MLLPEEISTFRQKWQLSRFSLHFYKLPDQARKQQWQHSISGDEYTNQHHNRHLIDLQVASAEDKIHSNNSIHNRLDNVGRSISMFLC